MRKIWCIFWVCIFLGLCGCAGENNPYLELDDSEFFDAEREHKPSDEEVLSVCDGMAFYDVVEMIGLPHERGVPGMSGASNHHLYRWDTIEGNTYYILFLPKKEIENWYELPLCEYHLHTVAVGKPDLVENE